MRFNLGSQPSAAGAIMPPRPKPHVGRACRKETDARLIPVRAVERLWTSAYQRHRCQTDSRRVGSYRAKTPHRTSGAESLVSKYARRTWAAHRRGAARPEELATSQQRAVWTERARGQVTGVDLSFSVDGDE
jgi:hypothetical protein